MADLSRVGDTEVRIAGLNGTDTADVSTANQLHVALYAWNKDESEWTTPRVDSSSRSFQTVTYEHHEVHHGDHYFYTDSLAVSKNSSQQYMITTPNTTKWAHFLMFVSASVNTTVELFEDGDRTGTTSQTIYNSNRNSANTSGLTLHKGTSGGSTDGTRIYLFGIGGTEKVGGSGGRETELILKQNAKYILEVTANAENDTITTRLDWYEHTDAGAL